LLVPIIAAAIMATVFYPRDQVAPQTRNFGFGPGWDCTKTGYGDPVCIKRPPPASYAAPAAPAASAAPQ
jgi:hypothetical protein